MSRWWCVIFGLVGLAGTVQGQTNRWLFHAIDNTLWWEKATVSDGLDVAYMRDTENELCLWRASTGTNEVIARRADIARHFSPGFSYSSVAARIAPNGDLYHAWLAGTYTDANALAAWETVTFRSQGTNRMTRVGRKRYTFSTVSEYNVVNFLRVDANGRTALVYNDIPVGGPHFAYADLGDVVIRTEILRQSAFTGFQRPFLGDHGESLVPYVFYDENQNPWTTIYLNGAEYLTAPWYRTTFVMNPDGSVYEYFGVGHPTPGMIGHLNAAFAIGDATLYANGSCVHHYAVGAYPLKSGRFIAVCCASEDANSAVVGLRDGFDCSANKIIGVGDPLFGSTVVALFPPAILGTGFELIAFEAPGCNYCPIFRRDVVPSYAATRAGKTAPLRFIDVNDTAADRLQLSGPVTMVPTVVLVRDGVEIGRINGYFGRENMHRLLDTLLPHE